MPSPFPGMDPYLEGSQWPSMHFGLASEIARQLSPKLRPRYFVRADERQVISVSEGDWGDGVGDEPSRYPDVAVMWSGRRDPLPAGAGGGGGGTAIAPVEVATDVPEAVPQVTLEIRDADEHRLVCSMEILSPVNKGSGRAKYLRKRARVLASPAHLVEIDLLRHGRRVPARSPLPPASYYVYVSRADRRPLMQVWPVRLEDALPGIPVPLLPGDPDLTLDLQRAFSDAYDVHGYDLAIDYGNPPKVRLTPAQADWAAGVIRAARDRAGTPPA